MRVSAQAISREKARDPSLITEPNIVTEKDSIGAGAKYWTVERGLYEDLFLCDLCDVQLLRTRVRKS